MRLSRSLCALVGEALSKRNSHATLNALFMAAGAPGGAPDMSHASKWKEWLFRAGTTPEVNSLQVLGTVIEEFMDLPPNEFAEGYASWKADRARVEQALEENGLRYFRFGRVLPQDAPIPAQEPPRLIGPSSDIKKPGTVGEAIEVVARNLRRAIYPLTNRRKGATALTFSNEYDVQDLLHAMLRPWVMDIRPEEFTPSYGGKSTRMDLLLPAHKIVVETKIARNLAHAQKLADELIIDLDHYHHHADVEQIWCVIYDPQSYIENPKGLISALEGERINKGKKVRVRVFIPQER